MHGGSTGGMSMRTHIPLCGMCMYMYVQGVYSKRDLGAEAVWKHFQPGYSEHHSLNLQTRTSLKSSHKGHS